MRFDPSLCGLFGMYCSIAGHNLNIAGSVMISRETESVLISRLSASISIHGKFAESKLNFFEEVFSDPTAFTGINGCVFYSSKALIMDKSKTYKIND